MTKAEIVNSIAQRTGISKPEVSATVEALMDEIRNSLVVNKENVYLRGFGSFIVKHRAKKTARNISKNTTLVIEAHDLPAFKPCKSFIEKMSQSD
jgi:DNA-binding protein HU-beta